MLITLAAKALLLWCSEYNADHSLLQHLEGLGACKSYLLWCGDSAL